MVKFLDLIGFEKRFEKHYVHPKREPKLGGYRMVSGILMLLFIGFQRLGHFGYIRKDTMLCGISARVGVAGGEHVLEVLGLADDRAVRLTCAFGRVVAGEGMGVV